MNNEDIILPDIKSRIANMESLVKDQQEKTLSLERRVRDLEGIMVDATAHILSLTKKVYGRSDEAKDIKHGGMWG